MIRLNLITNSLSYIKRLNQVKLMGPKQSTIEGENTKQIRINHPMFTLAQQVQGTEQLSFIRTRISLPSKQVFDEWYTRAKSQPQNQCLMQSLTAQYIPSGMCGTSGTAIIQYPDYQYLLSGQIQNRKQKNIKLFDQSEMWYLIYTILSAASGYHQQGVKAGDIRPDNIFINQDGQVKVASVDSWPAEQPNYAKSFYQKQITYLSPEEVKDYQFGKIQQSTDKQLSQTFSMGLTILDAATLSSSKSLYSKNFKFNYEKLQSRLTELQKSEYSQMLVLAIESMCEIDAEFRVSGRQLIQWLKPYEEAIVNLFQFQPAELPPKLQVIKERNSKSQQSQLTNIQTPIAQYSYPISAYNKSQSQSQYMIVNAQRGAGNNGGYGTSYGASGSAGIGYHQQIFTNYAQSYNSPVYTPPVYAPPRTFDVPSTYNLASTNNDIHKATLSKIDQQLQRSKLMFPQ